MITKTKKYLYFGVLSISFSTLILEIVLTRIFSVATWYYFAFFAVSLSMFGLAVGGLLVYLHSAFTADKTIVHLFKFSLMFGISIILSILCFLSIPFYPRPTGIGIFSTIFIFLVLALPFTCSGVCICLALTRFPKIIGKVYAFDLAGAAFGAFLVVPVLDSMDAVTAIFLSGALAVLASYLFAKLLNDTSALKKASFAFFAIFLLMMTNYFSHSFRVEWVKMRWDNPLEEHWNAISRVAVYPFQWVKYPYSWGLSKTFKPKRPVGEMMINIDGVSETVMTYFNSLKDIEHLKYDVTFIAHYLRANAKVFIIGIGGGRDVAAAYLFHQPLIIGAEVNDTILSLIKGKYGSFTGHLDKLPGVHLVAGEARSTLTSMHEKFDIIQASCIATWSATTAGAFSLAENSLYTVEAWKIFFNHLTPHGILSFNRWYSPDYPAQLLRLASLAATTLKELGIADPARHICVIRNEPFPGIMPSGTILVSKSPFLPSDLDKLQAICQKLKFKIVYSPRNKNPYFQKLIDNVGNSKFYKSLPLDLSAPTDNRPFFFQMLRLKDAFSRKPFKFNEQRFNFIGVFTLVVLLIIAIVLSIIFIIIPVAINFKRKGLSIFKQMHIFVLFFAMIGLAYIFIEMSQIQCLTVFLGHPIYSMTVVLFTLLLSSGLGSMVSEFWRQKSWGTLHYLLPLLILLLIGIFIISIQTDLIQKFIITGKATRITVAVLFLLPLGFFMGFPFPLGMSLALSIFPQYAPWFWAINGATSVVASVAAVCISIAYGINMTFKIGLVCYFMALICMGLAFKGLCPSK